nr:fibulin 1 variant C - mouse (fragments) [Mus musculus]
DISMEACCTDLQDPAKIPDEEDQED